LSTDRRDDGPLSTTNFNGKKNAEGHHMKAQKLVIEQLEERIAPGTVGALHNNPSNPNNNNNHNSVPKGALPEGTN
jgi:hypothetical protein